MDVIETATNASETTSSIKVAAGTLKASMRSVVGDSAENFQPQYDFTQSVALEPLRVSRLNIAMQSVAYSFRAGSRIILTVTQAEDDSLADLNRQDSIFHSERYPSRIWLPVLTGELATDELEDDLSDIPVDLQSQLIPNPISTIIFDTEFLSDFNNGEESEALSEAFEEAFGDSLDGSLDGSL